MRRFVLPHEGDKVLIILLGSKITRAKKSARLRRAMGGGKRIAPSADSLQSAECTQAGRQELKHGLLTELVPQSRLGGHVSKQFPRSLAV